MLGGKIFTIKAMGYYFMMLPIFESLVSSLSSVSLMPNQGLA